MAIALAQRGQAPLPPPASIEAPAIPGVIAAGTRIELVTYPLQGTEGPVGMLYMVGANAAFRVQTLSQGFKGRAK